MSLYVCGDTHGDIDIRKLRTRFFRDAELTKNDYVLICGDCGAVWDGGSFDRYIQRWFGEKPWTTLYIDGNHENHAMLDKLPVVQWNGGKVHKISESIIHLIRGQVYTIDDHKIFTMGGASSHDKEYRKENISWWERELPSDDEYQTAIENLEANGNEVEYIFTHCASDRTQRAISNWFVHDKLTNFFDKVIEDEIKFKQWYFGHYHVDCNIDAKHIAVYNQVIKLW